MNWPFMNVVAVGITGSGKSAVCARLAELCQGDASLFTSSDDASAHTQQPAAIVCGARCGSTVVVTDTPGLMDPRGQEADEVNIRNIVEFLRAQKVVSAMALVCNESNARFDFALQNVVQLLVDSFGDQMLKVMCVVFTCAAGMRSREEARQTAHQFARMIEQRAGIPEQSLILPVFQVDCFPNNLAKLGVGESRIQQVQSDTRTALLDMVRWACAHAPVSTQDAVYGEYETSRARREAEQAAVLAEQQRAEQEAKAQLAEQQRAEQEAKAKQAAVLAELQQAQAQKDAEIAKMLYDEKLAAQQREAQLSAQLAAQQHQAELAAQQYQAQIAAQQYQAQIAAASRRRRPWYRF